MHFALQREMAGLGVGTVMVMVMVEILNGPINDDDDCRRVMMFVLKICLNL